ncbi:MAG TPA: hypothetical protein VLJ68_01220, partial [Chitinophagaceae bacterium]|nr:hypothetical protein [Chitinophagaceae bacterium]
MLKILAWAGLIAVATIMFFQNRSFKKVNTTGYGVVSLELAKKTKGETILRAWHDADSNLPVKANKMIKTDFFFLLFYSWVLFLLSNSLIYHEKSLLLNTLLRMNLLLAPLAGLLDITENILMLYNINHYSQHYISSSLFAWLKFILAGWVVLVCLVS